MTLTEAVALSSDLSTCDSVDVNAVLTNLGKLGHMELMAVVSHAGINVTSRSTKTGILTRVRLRLTAVTRARLRNSV